MAQGGHGRRHYPSGGGGGRSRVDGGWWGGSTVVYVNDVADCPPGYEASQNPDGTVVCTRISAGAFRPTYYDPFKDTGEVRDPDDVPVHGNLRPIGEAGAFVNPDGFHPYSETRTPSGVGLRYNDAGALDDEQVQAGGIGLGFGVALGLVLGLALSKRR